MSKSVAEIVRAAITEALGDAEGQCGESLAWLGQAYANATYKSDREEYAADIRKIEANLRAALAALDTDK